MKRHLLITIETTGKTNFGLVFMTKVIREVVMLLNGYRKCYIVTVQEMKSYNG